MLHDLLHDKHTYFILYKNALLRVSIILLGFSYIKREITFTKILRKKVTLLWLECLFAPHTFALPIWGFGTIFKFMKALCVSLNCVQEWVDWNSSRVWKGDWKCVSQFTSSQQPASLVRLGISCSSLSWATAVSSGRIKTRLFSVWGSLGLFQIEESQAEYERKQLNRRRGQGTIKEGSIDRVLRLLPPKRAAITPSRDCLIYHFYPTQGRIQDIITLILPKMA